MNVIRNNPKVTINQHRLGCFNKFSFYDNEIKLWGNELIVNDRGELIAVLMKGILTLPAVTQAEKYLHQVQLMGAKFINNSRGQYKGFLVGLIKESGGKGWIRYHNDYDGFLINTLQLRTHVEDIILHVAPIFARTTDHIPDHLIPCKPIDFLQSYTNLYQPC